MSHHSSPVPDPSRHRRYKPGKAASSFPELRTEQAAADTETRNGLVSSDWRTAVRALEQNYGARLADIEERLAASEREVSNLGGQIKEMR